MVEHAGWEGLARDIPINCFRVDPSMTSALKYLRKAPRARKKVEDLYARFVSRRGGGTRPAERSAGIDPALAQPHVMHDDAQFGLEAADQTRFGRGHQRRRPSLPPARAVRPTRCRYALLWVGTSRLTMSVMPAMSRPRAAHVGRHEHARPAAAEVLHRLLAIALVRGGMEIGDRDVMVGELRRHRLGRVVAMDEHHGALAPERVEQLAQHVRLVALLADQIEMLDVLCSRTQHPARTMTTSGASDRDGGRRSPGCSVADAKISCRPAGVAQRSPARRRGSSSASNRSASSITMQPIACALSLPIVISSRMRPGEPTTM